LNLTIFQDGVGFGEFIADKVHEEHMLHFEVLHALFSFGIFLFHLLVDELHFTWRCLRNPSILRLGSACENLIVGRREAATSSVCLEHGFDAIIERLCHENIFLHVFQKVQRTDLAVARGHRLFICAVLGQAGPCFILGGRLLERAY
jgi:hypothetical protein